MAQRCSLCGAKLQPEDRACRECGVARAPVRAGTPAVAAAAAEAASLGDDSATPSDPAPAPAAEPSVAPPVETPALSLEDPVMAIVEAATSAPTEGGPDPARPAKRKLRSEAVTIPNVEPPVGLTAPKLVQSPPPAAGSIGSAPGSMAVPPAAAPPPAASAAPAATPAVVPPAAPPRTPARDDGDGPRKGSSFGLVVVGVLLLGAIGGGAWYATRDPGATPVDEAPTPDDVGVREEAPAVAAPEEEACAGLAQLQGDWFFHTEVTASRVLSSSGLNGFYELSVSVDTETCTATATLTKTGYTGRRFAADDRQSAAAKLMRGEGVWSFGWLGTFQLRADDDDGGDFELAFRAEGDRLSGVYRQRGERWTKTGLTGFLQGSRSDDVPSDPVLGDQPCPIRCAVTCDVAHRDEGLDASVIDGCTDACDDAGTELPACGDAKPLPAEFSLAMTGPMKIKDHCAKLGGCLAKVTVGKDRAPWLAARRFDAGFEGARFVVPKKKDKRPRLAVQLADGWYVSEPLVGPAAKGKLDLARLYGRHLGEGEGKRHLFGLVATQVRGKRLEAYLQCRVEGGAPKCIRIPKTRGTYVSPLPGGSVAIGPGPEDTELGPGPGVYRW